MVLIDGHVLASWAGEFSYRLLGIPTPEPRTKAAPPASAAGAYPDRAGASATGTGSLMPG